MNNDQNPLTIVFENFSKEEVHPGDLGFAFFENKMVYIEINDRIHIPTVFELREALFEMNRIYYLGSVEGNSCYGIELTSPNVRGYEAKELRALIPQLSQQLFLMAGRAYQLVNFGVTHRFCGKCGNTTEEKEGERALFCPSCGALYYPRLSPAIIVAVLKEDQILLAHNNHFTQRLFSLVAGFVEPGETFEDCVAREVKEEIGIDIDEIQYFGSQPWPFPDSLMIGFTAQYAGGSIEVDGVEIGEAGWYSRDNMPDIPHSHSIAGKMIRAFISNTIGR